MAKYEWKSDEEKFEAIGFLAIPNVIKSIEVQVPENLLEKFKKEYEGKYSGEYPYVVKEGSKRSYQFRITLNDVDGCPEAITELLDTRYGNRINNTKRESSWNMGLGKKIIIILCIIVLALLLFSLVYNLTQPSYQESLNVISDDGSQHQTSSYPYKAVIKYDGSWYASLGNPNYPTEYSGYGSKTISLDCAVWDMVDMEVQKQDYGEGELKIQLLKNGEVVAENSTTNTTGNLVINYNY